MASFQKLPKAATLEDILALVNTALMECSASHVIGYIHEDHTIVAMPQAARERLLAEGIVRDIELPRKT